ncbi:hypothetical protein RAS2_00180 [Phycisphaerae bacterium RAS2]|nr:hypothetical protein RAS2_00180 [Phycisphaerae bacterium RAS2]
MLAGLVRLRHSGSWLTRLGSGAQRISAHQTGLDINDVALGWALRGYRLRVAKRRLKGVIMPSTSIIAAAAGSGTV